MSAPRKAVAASITYRLTYSPHPWPAKAHEGMSCWILVREVWIGQSFLNGEPVAIFNLDSEGQAFKQFLEAGGDVRTE